MLRFQRPLDRLRRPERLLRRHQCRLAQIGLDYPRAKLLRPILGDRHGYCRIFLPGLFPVQRAGLRRFFLHPRRGWQHLRPVEHGLLAERGADHDDHLSLPLGGSHLGRRLDRLGRPLDLFAVRPGTGLRGPLQRRLGFDHHDRPHRFGRLQRRFISR